MENVQVIPVILEFSSNQDKALKELSETLGVLQEKINGKEFQYKITGDMSQLEKMINEISNMGFKDLKINFDTTEIGRIKSSLKQDGKGLDNALAVGNINPRDSSLLKESFKNLRKNFGAGMLQELQQGIRQVYENVKIYDKAVVNLQVASGKTREEVNSLMETYTDMAKTLGTTVAEMSGSAESWLRQGYTLKETNDLIEASLVQSKLGQLDSAESAKYLASALNGYKIEAEDALSVVDKMSAVDYEAAVSLGGLAEAMSETSNSARIAGVSIDKLLGYEAVIGEATQNSMSSVGSSLNQIFSRIGDIKAGKFVDDEGEDISKVENNLGRLGIKLRDTQNEFRNFGEVLDEIASDWSSFSDAEQNTIVTALAGTSQSDNLLVLLQNYGEAIKYTETAIGASGTALEKYSAYQDSVEAKTKKLQASFQELSNTFLDSSFVKDGLDFLSGLLTVLDTLIEKLGTVGTLATIGSGVLGAKGLG